MILTDEKEGVYGESLRSTLGEAERLTPIHHYRFPTSVQRHYERMASFPEGFLILGDAVCSFNPIYAQGMSAAALQVSALQQLLAERAAQSRGLEGIARSFFPKVAEINCTPWSLAAGFDFAHPQTGGERPQDIEQGARYFVVVDQLQREDPAVQRLVTEVFQLTKPLSVLNEELLRRRVFEQLGKQAGE